MIKSKLKKAVQLVPQVGGRIGNNESLAEIICSFSKALKLKGLALAFYVTGNYSNQKMWGVFSLEKGRPNRSKDCKYLSNSFSHVGSTKKCMACIQLLELQKQILSRG